VQPLKYLLTFKLTVIVEWMRVGSVASEPGGNGGSTMLLALVAIAVIFFAATSVAFGYFLVFGENLAGPPQNVYTISLTEYLIEPNPDPIIVKVGQPVVFRIVNEGAVEHELMFVPDPEMMASMLKNAALRLQQENPDLSEEEIIEIVEKRHDEIMHEMLEEVFEGKIEGELSVELEPGESVVITLTFYEPGVYVIGCFKQVGTFPETHAEEGMFNQVIVVEG
jgi:uncharacterized cupredoxin-like copper-binding protein